MKTVFQRDCDFLCRVFTYMVIFVFQTHRHRVQDYLGFWRDYFQTFSDCIARKRVNQYGLSNQDLLDHEQEHVIGFIDGTLRRCCRPSPVDGLDVQRLVYNGWKKFHCLKFQAVEFPNGMTGDMFGPVTGSHNDNYALRMSLISERLRNIQVGENVTFALYGDSAYPYSDTILRPYKGQINGEQSHINGVWSKLRIAVEWNATTLSSV